MKLKSNLYKDTPTSSYSHIAAGIRPDQGMFFRSKWEANYARWLNWLIEHDHSTPDKRVMSWEYEPKRYEWLGGSYLPDFKVYFEDGHIEFHEIKGRKQGLRKAKRFAKEFNEILIFVGNIPEAQIKYAPINDFGRRAIKDWE